MLIPDFCLSLKFSFMCLFPSLLMCFFFCMKHKGRFLKLSALMHACIPELGRSQRQEDQVLSIILGYLKTTAKRALCAFLACYLKVLSLSRLGYRRKLGSEHLV